MTEQFSTQEQRIAELERFWGQLALENQVLKKTYRAGIQQWYVMIEQAH